MRDVATVFADLVEAVATLRSEPGDPPLGLLFRRDYALAEAYAHGVTATVLAEISGIRRADLQPALALVPTPPDRRQNRRLSELLRAAAAAPAS